MSDRVEELVK